MPGIPAFRRLQQEHYYDFAVGMVFLVSSSQPGLQVKSISQENIFIASFKHNRTATLRNWQQLELPEQDLHKIKQADILTQTGARLNIPHI